MEYNIDECPICFENLDNTMDIVIFECKHKFHLKCINEWFSVPRSNYKCPNCSIQRNVIKIIPKLIKEPTKSKKEKNCVVT